MVSKEREDARALALILSLGMVVLFALDVEPAEVGIYEGAGLSRLLYPFFHASWLHVLMNVWCLLCVVFYYRTKAVALAIAYLISVSFPVDTFTAWGICNSDVTIGLSGLCFALLGDVSHESSNRLRFHAYMGTFLGLGFLFPNINAMLHLYCYVMGVLFGHNSFKED